MITLPRNLWRADLEDYHADLLRSVGLTADADEKKLSADLRRTEASMADELEVSRAVFLADVHDVDAKRTYKAKGAELHEFRKKWRAMGELAGSRHPVGSFDHFTEPSDEELAS